MSYMNMPGKEVEVVSESDVVVIGAGLAGIAAAIIAARSGLKTALIEGTGKPGGIPTTGLLGVVSGFKNEHEKCVAGFPLEVRNRMLEAGGIGVEEHIWDPEILNMVLLEMLAESGVKTFFYTKFIDASAKDEQVDCVFTASKSGMAAMKAKLFIDASGDADVAACVGCPCEKGRESDGLMQSATLVVKIGGIDPSLAPACSDITEIWKRNDYDVPIDHAVVSYIPHWNADSEATINMAHIINFDGTSTTDLTRARFEGTKQAMELLRFFRERVPGFENAYISQTANQIGVRETRRIVGDYKLTYDDLVNGKDFDDEIARGCWPIDIHSPNGIHTGIGEHLKRSYGVPYRCILPQNIKNLYVVGRPISADHVAFSSTRINSTCAALGHAAGCAAKMALGSGDIRKVDVAYLQDQLILQNAITHSCHIEQPNFQL